MSMKPLKSESSSWKRFAKRLVPAPVRARLRELRALSGSERRAHVSASLRRIAGAPAPVPATLAPDGALLFVCHGNIIRSALAAALAHRHADSLGISETRIASAGLSARPGREADARAVAAGQTFGVDLREHRAQPLTRELVDAASVIYVMDRLNEAQTLARFPDATSKVRRLGALALTNDGDVIPDPYVLDAAAVASVAERIDRATLQLMRELARRAGGGRPSE